MPYKKSKASSPKKYAISLDKDSGSIERNINSYSKIFLYNNPELTKYTKYAFDPVGFIEKVLDFKLYTWQEEVCGYILNTFKENNDKKHFVCLVAIAGGNGTGKSRLGYALMIWRFCCFPGSRQFTLTNSERQTRSTGWGASFGVVKHLFPRFYRESSNKMFFLKEGGSGGHINTNNTWDYSFLLQSGNESAISGLHDPAMSFFLDECTFFMPHVWSALRNMLTQGHVLAYVSGNPVSTTYNGLNGLNGFNGFYNIFRKEKIRKEKGDSIMWYCRNISAIDDVPDSHINKSLLKDDLKSEDVSVFQKNRIRANILGQFPESTKGQLFERERLFEIAKVENLHEYTTNNPLIMGVDVAEGVKGGSASAVCLRKDNVVRQLQVFDCDYIEFEHKLLSLINETRPDVIIVDANGIGYSLYNSLRRISSLNIVPVKFTQKATEPTIYKNRYSEIGYLASKWVEREDVSIPYNLPFINGLSVIMAEVDGMDCTISLSGKKTKAAERLNFGIGVDEYSQDLVDAFFLTFDVSSPVFMISNISNSWDYRNLKKHNRGYV